VTGMVCCGVSASLL